MIALMLAGLFALAFGKLSITSSLGLRDKYARLYGVALLVAAIPISAIAAMLVGAVLPGVVADSGPRGMIIRLAICIVTAVPFHRDRLVRPLPLDSLGDDPYSPLNRTGEPTMPTRCVFVTLAAVRLGSMRPSAHTSSSIRERCGMRDSP